MEEHCCACKSYGCGTYLEPRSRGCFAGAASPRLRPVFVYGFGRSGARLVKVSRLGSRVGQDSTDPIFRMFTSDFRDAPHLPNRINAATHQYRRLRPAPAAGLKGRSKMKNLFVGNMSFQTAEADLRALFAPFGEITRVHVAKDRETGRARGFGFVEMANDEEAAKAIAALDGKEFGGRNLKVNEATPKGDRPGPRSGSGGGGNRGGGNSGGGGGGNRNRFSNEDYRESAR